MNDATYRAIRHGVSKVLSRANREQDTDDVTHDVIVALMEMKSYDPEVGDYASYAYGVAQQMAVNYLNTDGGVTTVPRWAGEWRSKQYATEVRLGNKLLRQPTHAEIAEAMGETLSSYAAKMNGVWQHAADPALSYEDEEGNEVDLADVLDYADLNGLSPLEAMEISEGRELLWQAINRLPDDTRDIVCLMFGFNSRGNEYSIREVAEVLGMPSSTVHYKLTQALNALRKEVADVE